MKRTNLRSYSVTVDFHPKILACTRTFKHDGTQSKPWIKIGKYKCGWTGTKYAGLRECQLIEDQSICKFTRSLNCTERSKTHSVGNLTNTGAGFSRDTTARIKNKDDFAISEPSFYGNEVESIHEVPFNYPKLLTLQSGEETSRTWLHFPKETVKRPLTTFQRILIPPS